MTIHNPWGIKLSAKDISQGWRFCFVEELLTGRPMDAKYKLKGDPAWTDTINPGKRIEPELLNSRTYITKTPIPDEKKMRGVKIPQPISPVTGQPESDDALDVLTKFLGD